jgi:hypothetical protein
MKTILVYGDDKNEILDKILVETIPDLIMWRNSTYTVKNSELGYLVDLPKDKNINDYNGTFFFYYDD